VVLLVLGGGGRIEGRRPFGRRSTLVGRVRSDCEQARLERAVDFGLLSDMSGGARQMRGFVSRGCWYAQLAGRQSAGEYRGEQIFVDATPERTASEALDFANAPRVVCLTHVHSAHVS
jgi:hypothetical protein